jgi:hypothetical protein
MYVHNNVLGYDKCTYITIFYLGPSVTTAKFLVHPTRSIGRVIGPRPRLDKSSKITLCSQGISLQTIDRIVSRPD